MSLKNILSYGILATLLFACKENKLDIDVSNIKVQTSFINLDSIIYKADSSQLLSFHRKFQRDIKEIYEYQLGYCLKIGNVADSTLLNSIHQFRNDRYMIQLEKRIHEKFADYTPYKSNIQEALKHLKHHFPQGKFPQNIVFMNSIFQSNAWSTNNEIGIGVERYLGQNTDVIQQLPNEPFYDWIKKGMDKTYLERDAICSWIMTHYVPEGEKDLAESIVRWGKIIYLTEAAFPTMPKHIIMRYTEKDLQWAINNEYPFWKYLVDEKLLFKNSERDKSNMLNDGPFTIGLPEKGPDRLGQFIGWRIVQKYMEKNDISLSELMKIPYTELIQEYEIED